MSTGICTGAAPPYPVEHRGTRQPYLIIRRIFCGLGENEKKNSPSGFPEGVANTMKKQTTVDLRGSVGCVHPSFSFPLIWFQKS